MIEYETPRLVKIHNRKVGLVRRIIQLCIILYVALYALWLQKGYQEFGRVESSVTTKIKGVTKSELDPDLPFDQGESAEQHLLLAEPRPSLFMTRVHHACIIQCVRRVPKSGRAGFSIRPKYMKLMSLQPLETSLGPFFQPSTPVSGTWPTMSFLRPKTAPSSSPPMSSSLLIKPEVQWLSN